VRWSLTMDRRWFVKNTLSWLVVFTLVFLFFTCVTKFNDSLAAYQACASMVLCTTIAILVLGPTMMFNSMQGKHDDQRLLMLPASNLEKYLVRYSYWLLLLPCFVGSFIVADLLQYLVNWLSGHEGRMLVMQYLMSLDFNIVFPPSNVVPQSLIVCIVLTFVWLHSCYAVGATFFRSHKHSWILTSVALIAFGIILGSLWPHDEMSRSISSHTAVSLLRLWDVIYIFLIAFNYWLSYKFFCRQQVIGKYVNV
jgi:hypothetical protein